MAAVLKAGSTLSAILTVLFNFSKGLETSKMLSRVGALSLVECLQGR